ncbi:MAG: hypothetical protein WAN03_04510 [Candidatus Sulfotelmatobacter sp.]
MHTGKLIKDMFDAVKEAENSAGLPSNQTSPQSNEESRQEGAVPTAESHASRPK